MLLLPLVFLKADSQIRKRIHFIQISQWRASPPANLNWNERHRVRRTTYKIHQTQVLQQKNVWISVCLRRSLLKYLDRV